MYEAASRPLSALLQVIKTFMPSFARESAVSLIHKQAESFHFSQSLFSAWVVAINGISNSSLQMLLKKCFPSKNHLQNLGMLWLSTDDEGLRLTYSLVICPCFHHPPMMIIPLYKTSMTSTMLYSDSSWNHNQINFWESSERKNSSGLAVHFLV